MKIEPATFWDKKIKQWEKDKYFNNRKASGIINFDVNTSVKARLELARLILKNVVRDLTVVEVGCGSALLMEDILSFGANKYIGIDVSPVAIEATKQRAQMIQGAENTAKIELITKNVNVLNPIDADICFSLGLFDWLSLDDISLLQKKINSKYYFHTFSEKRELSFQQILHRIYVYLMYGHKNNTYIPQYYSANKISQALDKKNSTHPQFFRHDKLSFGCFVYHLPRPIEGIK